VQPLAAIQHAGPSQDSRTANSTIGWHCDHNRTRALIAARSLRNEWTYSWNVSASIGAVLIVVSINLGALRKDDKNTRLRDIQMKSVEGFREKQADSNSA
jgi:hypothetical protein